MKDPYKILWNGYMCDYIFDEYLRLQKQLTIARLKYEVFCKEVFNQ